MIRSHKLLLTPVILFISILILSLTINPIDWLDYSGNEKYKAEWKKVEALENKGLPKSALEQVELIFKMAEKTDNQEQIVKAIIYRSKYMAQTEEDAFPRIIAEVETQEIKSKFPAKQLLNTYIASYYWSYYTRISRKVNQRTIIPGFQSEDIFDWDKLDFQEKMREHLYASLKDADQLQRVRVSDFEEIINEGNYPTILRPSLLDFLANRAIFYLNTTKYVNPLLSDAELLADSALFDLSQYHKLNLKTEDQSSNIFHSLKLYQQLIQLNLKRSDKTPLLDNYLNYLAFLQENSSQELINDHYFKCLTGLQKRFAGVNYEEEINYLIAEHYSKKANLYNYIDSITYEYAPIALKCKNLLESIIEHHPKSYSAEKSKQLLDQITVKQIDIQSVNHAIPNKAIPLKIEFKNINSAYLFIYKIDTAEYLKETLRHSGIDLIKRICGSSNLTKKERIDFPIEIDLNQHATEYILDGLSVGKYVIALSEDDKFTFKEKAISWKFLNITNISYINRQNPEDGNNDFFVFNRTTGYPQKGVELSLYQREYSSSRRQAFLREVGIFQSDKEGFIEVYVPSSEYRRHNFSMILRSPDDFLIPDEQFYQSGRATKQENIICSIYTDRKIYRPGQMVHFKGILHLGTGADSRVVPGKHLDFVLKDVNYQEAGKASFTSNSYGSFSGVFHLPKSALTGDFKIISPYGNTNIRVEEYKRPRIEIEFHAITEQYRLNDTIKVKGIVKSLSGQTAGDALIKYTITRSGSYDYKYYWPRMENKQIASGSTACNKKGEFEIHFLARTPFKMPDWQNQFTFNVELDATDISGETQSASKPVVVHKNVLFIETDFPKKADLQEAGKSHQIWVKTYNHHVVDTSVTINLYKLKSPDLLHRKQISTGADLSLYSKSEWKQKLPEYEYDDELNPAKFKREKQLHSFILKKGDRAIDLQKLGIKVSGHYLMELLSYDQYGQRVAKDHYTYVYDGKSGELASPEVNWFVQKTKSCEPGSTAQILVGSSLKVKFLLETYSNKKLMRREWISIRNEQKLIEIPVSENDRGGIIVNLTLVVNNHIYQNRAFIKVPFSNKKLDVTFETFRDYLKPGEAEEWKINIKGNKGDAVLAEMLCTMYDVSLDQFIANHWNGLFQAGGNYLSYFRQNSFEVSSGQSSYLYNRGRYMEPRYYDQLHWFGFRTRSVLEVLASGRKGRTGKSSLLRRENDMTEDRMDMQSFSALESPTKEFSGELEFTDEYSEHSMSIAEDNTSLSLPSSELEVDFSSIKTRSNFKETAFFYPHLMTNSEGDLVISFTMPESLTRWRINGLAHTKDLKTGFFQKELITRKELMAELNPPRFLRHKDVISMPVKLSNLTDSTMQLKVQLEFFNAISNEEISIHKDSKVKTVLVEANQSKVVSWEISIPDDVHAIRYLLKAANSRFSDGEERIIPVLSNRMLVTESMPFSVRTAGTTNFTFDKLKHSDASTTLKHHRLSLEFTENPAWYAVLALPYLMDFPHECAEQIFSRFYANALASHISSSNPKVVKVLKAWSSLPDSETFLSNLDKNPELKSIILNETPWIKDAQDEREQRKNIALLFDLNKLASEQQEALQKLLKMQNSDGSWSWFPGLRSNRYITQHIVSGMGHLHHLGVLDFSKDQKLSEAIKKAVFFLDEQIYRDYLRQKNPIYKSDKYLTNIAVHYIYMRSFFPSFKLTALHELSYYYFSKLAMDTWVERSKYDQAMIALALFRNSDTETPFNILKSLNEFALHSEEFGMYWKSKTGYYWYQAPIERQALMIELYQEVAKDEKSVDELKLWLLKQKQTQAWKTTKATADAIYALLNTGSDWLESNESANIRIGNHVIDNRRRQKEGVEAGSGYYKTSWSESEITADMSELTIEKTTKGVSWGALYWQYFEDLDRITSHDAGLKIRKSLYLEKKTGEKTVLVPLSHDHTLKVGDKLIVRLNLKADRNLEFVHMKDMRASGLEPLNVLSGHHYQGGLFYYESIRDAAVNFYIDFLPKGEYVFEYPLRAIHQGKFSNGITSIQCMYAPEFGAHSKGVTLKVNQR
jgi:uncharacterized protein YfaS (alpha-2-macroglobulin family)